MQSILSVITPASDYNLTSLENVKTELGITSDTQNVRLTSLITQISTAISTICDRVFAKETVSEVFRLGSGVGISFRSWHAAHGVEVLREGLVLRRRPVVSINSVEEDGEVVDPVEYEVNPGTGILYRLSNDDFRVGWRANKITVEYISGYLLLDELPSDLQLACILWIKMLNSQINQPNSSVKVEDVPDLMRREYFDPLRLAATSKSSYNPPNEVMVLLSPYIEVAIR